MKRGITSKACAILRTHFAINKQLLTTIAILIFTLLTALLCRLAPAPAIGNYWWDDMALMGGVAAIQQGLTPSVDFWAPLIFPLYTKWLAVKLASPKGHIWAECIIQCGISWIFYTTLIANHLSKKWNATFIIVLTLIALPINHSNIVTSSPGQIMYAGGYNRLCDALLFITALLPACQSSPFERHPIHTRSAIALMLLILFYTKISAFQVTVLILAAGLTAKNKNITTVDAIQIVAIFVIGAALIAISTHIGPDYLRTLKDIASIKSETIRYEMPFRLQQLWQRHWFEICTHAALITVGLIAILDSHAKKNKLQHQVTALLTYVGCLALIFTFTMTNYGDMGLTPAIACAYTFTDRLKENDRIIRIAGTTLSIILIATFLSVYVRWVRDNPTRQYHLTPPPIDIGYIEDNYQTYIETWLSRPNLTANPLTKEQDPKKPSAQLSYLAEIQPAIDFLNRSDIPKEKSIYALDFPAGIFSVLTGYRYPKHSYPWLLLGHEITTKNHPTPTLIFRDVDYIATSKCSMHFRNRTGLQEIYTPYIQENFTKIFNSPCWDIYTKKNQK